MAPNLLVAAQTAFQPHTWFKSKQPTASLTRTEIWTEPLPGVYKHTLGCGWAMVATQHKDGVRYKDLKTPRKVDYCRALHRWVFHDEVEARTMQGFFLSKPEQKTPLLFFRLDDGITWVQNFDVRGRFIPGPYQRFVLDADTKKFRPMLRCDDPAWQHRRRSDMSTHSLSAVSSLHTTSGASTPACSRNASTELALPQLSDFKRNSLAVPDPQAGKMKRLSSASTLVTAKRSQSPLATTVEEDP